jgi:hypothetical protein
MADELADSMSKLAVGNAGQKGGRGKGRGGQKAKPADNSYGVMLWTRIDGKFHALLQRAYTVGGCTVPGLKCVPRPQCRAL